MELMFLYLICVESAGKGMTACAVMIEARVRSTVLIISTAGRGLV